MVPYAPGCVQPDGAVRHLAFAVHCEETVPCAPVFVVTVLLQMKFGVMVSMLLYYFVSTPEYCAVVRGWCSDECLFRSLGRSWIVGLLYPLLITHVTTKTSK